MEYSALRQQELAPLAEYLLQNGLGDYDHVSVHAPSKYSREEETTIVEILQRLYQKFPCLLIVVHPDEIKEFALWKALGRHLRVENMYHHKPGGRSVEELTEVFSKLPEAQLCFDIGHAHEVDRSRLSGYGILQCFGHRIAQVHASEVTDPCAHIRLSAPLRNMLLPRSFA